MTAGTGDQRVDAGAADERGVASSVRGTRPVIGVVVLTTGARPDELARALASAHRQRGVDVEVVVVLNAPPATPHPDIGDATLVTPGRNLGIPAGRNLGVGALGDRCALVLFLDDDGELVGDRVLGTVADRFAADPRLAGVSLRIVDPETGATQRRHVPRLKVGDPTRSSRVTTFLGGASVLRRDAFEAAGGLPEEFFYAHEETSLAWRLLDLGYRLAYAGDLAMAHPATPPSRHATYHHLTARNRVLLARKHLPWPVAAIYLTLWTVLTLVRARGGRLASVRGFVDGWRMPAVERAPIGWRTVWRMTLTGRPPIL